MNHRRAIFSVVLIVFGWLALAHSSVQAAGSATFYLGQIAKPVEVGKPFTVDLNINPATHAVDTARASLSFSAELLTAVSFGLSGKLTSTSPGGGINNSAGTISGGGFTVSNSIVGISGSFARITFTPKAVGEAAIRVMGDSKLIDNGEEVGNPSGFNQIKIKIIPSTVSIQLTSPTHPNQDKWYQSNAAEFRWAGVTGGHYAWDFDQSPDTIPTQTTTDTTKKITGIKNGVWYFHLAQSPITDAAAVIHYRVRIDALAPNPIEPYLDIGDQKNLVVKFATTDYHSGIASYAIRVNQENTVENVASPYVLRGLNVGSNLITVTAYDQAGNPRTGWARFTLNEDGTIENVKVSGDISGVCALVPTLCDHPWVPATAGGASLALLTGLSVRSVRRRRLNLLNVKKVTHTDVGTVAKTTTCTDPKTGKKLTTKTVTKTDTKDVVETDSGTIPQNGLDEDEQETKQENQQEDKQEDRREDKREDNESQSN